MRLFWLRKKLKVTPEEIIITNGAQQAIALLCKTFLNRGEKVILERPAYLALFRQFRFTSLSFHSVDVMMTVLTSSSLKKNIKSTI